MSHGAENKGTFDIKVMLHAARNKEIFQKEIKGRRRTWNGIEHLCNKLNRKLSLENLMKAEWFVSMKSLSGERHS